MEKRVNKMLTKAQKGTPGAPVAANSLQATDEQEMAEAITACWDFLWEHAAGSP